MKINLYYQQIVMFLMMFTIGVFLNPMNMLLYRFDDFYISLTLIYSGLFMASNMVWGQQIIHFINTGHLNTFVLLIGIFMTILLVFLLRKQIFVDENQYLKRMITHHSTALTTSYEILNKSNDNKIKDIAKEIIKTQEIEIKQMKALL